MIEKAKCFTFAFTLMILLCIISGIAPSASAEISLPVHNIDSGIDYATIQEAIDADETLDGHRIIVDAGTYYENVVVRKTLSLIGENSSTTFLDGNGTGTVVSVVASNVSIAGFTIQNSGKAAVDNGISIDGSMRVNISNNVIRNCSCGIFVKDSNGNVFSGNRILKCSQGIRLYYSDRNVFFGCEISNNSRGILLSYSDSSVFSGNVILNNTEGLRIFVSKDNTIFHNNFVNNTSTIVNFDSISFWDNGVEGNFWSGYLGKDENQDGIGDVPFIIDANNTDRFPLMGMALEYDAIYEQEPYRISIVCNSTVSDFRFDVANMTLRFSVAWANATTCFCRVMVPKVLINWPYIVLVDAEQINSTVLPVSNYTHSFLYFTYAHTLNDRDVRITSKPYYQLMEKYNNLLAEYQKLNLTYNGLIASFDSLNATYRQLLAQYENLNSTYYELLRNYTQLEGDYLALNLTYYELQSIYNSLQISYTELNSTYFALVFNYAELQQSFSSLNTTHTDLLGHYYSLNSSYLTLNATYNALVGSFNELESEYETATYQLSVLNATYNELKLKQEATAGELGNVRNFMYVFLTTTFGVAVLFAFTVRYYRMFHEQEKVIERYKDELRRLSPFEVARVLFKSDAERLEQKIKRFEDKYGIKVHPSKTLEELFISLKVEKKRSEEA